LENGSSNHGEPFFLRKPNSLPPTPSERGGARKKEKEK